VCQIVKTLRDRIKNECINLTDDKIRENLLDGVGVQLRPISVSTRTSDRIIVVKVTMRTRDRPINCPN